MSEALVAVTDGWTERRKGSALDARLSERAGARSLKAALSEAGLGETASPTRRRHDTEGIGEPSHSQETALHRPGAPRVAASPSSIVPRPVFQGEPEAAVVRRVPQHDGVVSPPPWVRAARRGRWHARLMNTFGWMMALVVAGSIIGVAGQYLAVPPLGLESVMQARQ